LGQPLALSLTCMPMPYHLLIYNALYIQHKPMMNKDFHHQLLIQPQIIRHWAPQMLEKASMEPI
ncbi:MAG: hypothetical protein KZQ79_17395, partial [Candidatus Thiodiazotropha sp. (ex Lucinoma borealis)]|nr:hypothetical protein [Candidatus Thiodiazotropha sp. (ex Lucinoma borealis)]